MSRMEWLLLLGIIGQWVAALGTWYRARIARREERRRGRK